MSILILRRPPSGGGGGGGDLTHGQPFVLAGTFGTRGALTTIFRDWSEGVVGAAYPSGFVYDFSPNSASRPQYANNAVYNPGGRSLYFNLGSNSGTGSGDNVMYINGNWQEVYFSYRARLVRNATGGNTQIKMGRIMGDGPAPYTSTPAINPIAWFSGAPAGNFYIDCLGLGNNDVAYYSQNGVPNNNGTVWNHHEIYTSLGSSGTANGRRWHSLNDLDDYVQGSGSGQPGGQFSGALSGQPTLAHPSGNTVTLGSGADSSYIQKLMMPFYVTDDGGDVSVWLGEVFVQASTTADGRCNRRLIFANNASYYAATKKATQNVTSWSDPELSIDYVNQGNMSSGENCYAFTTSTTGLLTSHGLIGTWA